MGQTTPWPDLDPTAQLLIMLSMPSHNPKTNAKFWGLFSNDLQLPDTYRYLLLRRYKQYIINTPLTS